MQYLKLPPTPCYCCRVQLMLCIIQFRFFSGMVQYMLVFSTSVEVASKRHLVKSFYSSKCSHNPSGIILTRIGCLAPAGCTVSVCIQLHWQNSCFRKSRIRSFLSSICFMIFCQKKRWVGLTLGWGFVTLPPSRK